MNLKRLLQLLILAAVIVTGVQFARVYVHQLQLKKVMGDEALEARRAKYTAQTLENEIRNRLKLENASVPEHIEFEFEGVGDPKKDIVVRAIYTDVVNLFVYKHPMHMRIEARADAPK